MAPESLNALFWHVRSCGLVCGRSCGRGGHAAVVSEQLCRWGSAVLSSSVSSVLARMANRFCDATISVGFIGEVGKHQFLMFTLISTSNAPPRQACSGVGLVGMMVL